jgi:DNA invertase Pin-like site-specific DNA recombinase
MKDIKNGQVYSYVRWSSTVQELGDSEKRQVQLAQNWCQRNGRTLNERTFLDKGVSAWHGKNREKGALASLLKIVQPGDCILVENVDRWSREKPLKALTELQNAVERGVEFVFLGSGLTVNKNNFDDPSVLIPNFFGSFLAHEENQKKSERCRSAHRARRKLIENGQAVQGRLPCWLRWAKEQNKPVIVEEKARLVSRIFDLYLRGHAVNRIERLLSSEPAIGNFKKARWNCRSLRRLLGDKSVIGFHKGADTKVFPAIMSEEIYYKVASRLRENTRSYATANPNKNFLFVGLVKCSICGGSYVRHRSTSRSGNYTYLCCSNAARKIVEHKNNHVPYDLFYENFVATILKTDLIENALGRLENTAESFHGELLDTQKSAPNALGLKRSCRFPRLAPALSVAARR